MAIYNLEIHFKRGLDLDLLRLATADNNKELEI